MTSAPAASRRNSSRSVRVLEIERDAALRGVVVPERAGCDRDAARRRGTARRGARLAARRLDLDHVGAEIAEQLAAELALLVGQLQHAQAGQRPG